MMYARKCDVTGKGMNEGWYFENSGDYASTKEAMIQLCRKHYPEHKGLTDKKLVDIIYDDEGVYWTTWYDEEYCEGDVYYDAEGNEFEIEED